MACANLHMSVWSKRGAERKSFAIGRWPHSLLSATTCIFDSLCECGNTGSERFAKLDDRMESGAASGTETDRAFREMEEWY